MLKKSELFLEKRDFFIFFLTICTILSYSILIEFQNYKNLIEFDSYISNATVIKFYIKNNKQIVKFKDNRDFLFYTIISKKIKLKIAQKVKLEIWPKNLTFYKYLTTFFAYSKILSIDKNLSFRAKLNEKLAQIHKNQDIASIYQAIFLATPLPSHLQTIFSKFGVSHLFAISGFHLGILSAILFLILKFPYNFLQNRFFPYRSAKRDILIFTISILLIYTIFLDSPPSLLRAFTMLVIGTFLYDRAIKIISFQTLFLTIFLLLALFLRLFFNLGFWLSVSGVSSIFLFLIIFKNRGKSFIFFILPIWVYITMPPISIYLFDNFSIIHPLSIILTMLFSIFYPITLFLHLIGYGNSLDFVILSGLKLT